MIKRILRRIFRVSLLLIGLIPVCSYSQGTKGVSWEKVKESHTGTLNAYWYESRPFIYRDDEGIMRGIEPDILQGFRKYLKDNYSIELKINWYEANSFDAIYGRIRDGAPNGSLGVSALSITEEREAEVDFGPSYMSDICVLISSKNVPIVNSEAELNRVFSKLRAVTIKGTTYEQDLIRLKKNARLNFGIDFIPASQNILRVIESRNNAFGYIDLPIYLMLFNENPTINVERQNLSPIKRQGYAFIMPTGSDWKTPLEEYFESDAFKSQRETIIGHYINVELYRFVESLAIQSNEPVILLAKEKEIQQRDIAGKLEKIATETRRSNFMAGFAVVVLTFSLIIFLLYRKRNEQKGKIQTQDKNLAVKTEQLEKRNQQLMALDEEKNNLIKILAHDLRTPIQQVQGLAQLFVLSNPGLPEEQQGIIQKITDASLRLNKMITHILDIDALENNRVKVFMDDVKLNTLVEQVVKSFEKQAAKKNMLLIYSDKTRNSAIRGDSLFLIQVFENLISNAIKFSPAGKSVEVSIQEEAGRVRVTIKDNGPGFTEEDKHNIFKRFQRLSAQPTGGEGSVGLGLSIVKRYVELMRGVVTFESDAGHGAQFLVEFEQVGV
jgi:signal transduction histidine kinase